MKAYEHISREWTAYLCSRCAFSYTCNGEYRLLGATTARYCDNCGYYEKPKKGGKDEHTERDK